MKLNEPIGKAEYSPLFLRVPLGLYFIMAGLLKLNDVNVFIEVVKSYHILEGNLATLAGILIPYLEIGVGGLIILGLWTTLASVVASVLLTSFIYAIGVRVDELFNKDFILLGVSLSLLFSGPGAFSIDGIKK
jgi:uncharacterized membrane protein YphA (DoxX/SURF4 family)